MDVVLSPLVSTAVSAIEQVWDARMSKLLPVQIPDFSDPGLDDPCTAETPDRERLMRDRLLAVSAQLRRIGIVPAVRAMLRQTRTDVALMLLALPGCAPWTAEPAPHGTRHTRTGVDGTVYVLDRRTGTPAPHAEHVAVLLQQDLCLRMPRNRRSVVVTADNDIDCLSLACALRDVMLSLIAAGASNLAQTVSQRVRMPAAMLPQELLQDAMEPVERTPAPKRAATRRGTAATAPAPRPAAQAVSS